jgi:predicted nucleic acid-binding protein
LILFDTSVVLDARDPDSSFHAWARDRIAEAAAGDGAAVNTVVISESGVRSKTPDAVPGILQAMGLILLPLPISAAVPAAKAFAIYLARLKKEGKTSIARVPLPDFLIGAPRRGGRLATGHARSRSNSHVLSQRQAARALNWLVAAQSFTRIQIIVRECKDGQRS